MSRDPKIRDEIHYLLDNILSSYLDSDLDDGSSCLEGKHQLAELTIENFWRLHGKILLWAQAHMTGYSILFNTPPLVDFLEDKLGYEITEDSHVLEWIGLQYSFNVDENTNTDLIYGLLSEYETKVKKNGDEIEFLTPFAMRMMIDELLMSRSSNNSYWRFPLQRSLSALNEGQVDELSKPWGKKKQGKPFSLKQSKLQALQQVWFLVGQGVKKYRSLEKVANGIGQSTETLRQWEKNLKTSPDYAFYLTCSKLAGEFMDELQVGQYSDIPDYELYGMDRGVYSLELAQFLLPRLKENNLDKIKQSIMCNRKK